MPPYLSNPLHRPLAVHLKDSTLCCAGHSQLVPRVQADLLFTPATSQDAPPQSNHSHPVKEKCFANVSNDEKRRSYMKKYKKILAMSGISKPFRETWWPSGRWILTTKVCFTNLNASIIVSKRYDREEVRRGHDSSKGRRGQHQINIWRIILIESIESIETWTQCCNCRQWSVLLGLVQKSN